MKNHKIITILLLTLVSSSILAQDLSGKWNASMAGPQGAMYMVFDFAVEGDTLTGLLTSDMMGSTEISDGVINDTGFSFNVSMPAGPGGAMTMSFKGELENDALSMSMELPAFPGGAGAPPGGGPPPGGIPIAAIRAQ